MQAIVTVQLCMIGLPAGSQPQEFQTVQQQIRMHPMGPPEMTYVLVGRANPAPLDVSMHTSDIYQRVHSPCDVTAYHPCWGLR